MKDVAGVSWNRFFKEKKIARLAPETSRLLKI